MSERVKASLTVAVFLAVIMGILAAIAVPTYFALGDRAQQHATT